MYPCQSLNFAMHNKPKLAIIVEPVFWILLQDTEKENSSQQGSTHSLQVSKFLIIDTFN